MAAFANHKGGRLLVGVNDNKTISGTRSEDDKYMLDLAAHFYCKPEINIELIDWEIGGKSVVECIIPEGKEKPYYAKDEEGKWWVHIRVKDKTLLASKVVVDVLRRNTNSQGAMIQYSKHEEMESAESACKPCKCRSYSKPHYRKNRIFYFKLILVKF